MSETSSSYDPILAESEIRSLLYRERYYKDGCHWDKLRSCYHPDASKTYIDISWYKGDIDGFIAGAQKLTARNILHLITPIHVEIHGSKALAESVVNISVRYAEDGDEYDFASVVRAVSRLERLDDASSDNPWKMLATDVIYVRDSVVPVVPLSGPCKLNFDDVKDARKSYKYLTWHVRRHGGTVQNDLPGEDDPESVKAVMDHNNKWLES